MEQVKLVCVEVPSGVAVRRKSVIYMVGAPWHLPVCTPIALPIASSGRETF